MEQIFRTLTQLIKKYDTILLMTHKSPDFDGISSALALQSVITSFKKESYIICNSRKKDKSLEKAYHYMDENTIDYKFLNKQSINKYINENTLLIILDTHKRSMVEEESLIDKVENIVVIDHHIKSKDYIKKNILSYINANLSSTVEFMAHYLRFLNKTVPNLIATFMLVGLEIDTNNFKLKTTEKTYETAALLSRLGADNIIKQELLQETKNDYLRRQKIIEKSLMITSNMALCVAETEIYQKQDLASIAEELLQFENVEASFAIGKVSSKQVGISARSLGKINVEEIMEQLGGGGHLTEAATEMNCSVLEAEKQLLELVGGKK